MMNNVNISPAAAGLAVLSLKCPCNYELNIICSIYSRSDSEVER